MRVPVFFFNDTATTEIYTLSLHDALPIPQNAPRGLPPTRVVRQASTPSAQRSEEHTSELQSRRDLVCRLLLEKKKARWTRLRAGRLSWRSRPRRRRRCLSLHRLVTIPGPL